MKKIEDYTTDELSAKIEAIKAEREKTANALKKYEEELERRKEEVPSGVPSDGEYYIDWQGYVNHDRFEKKEDVRFNSFVSEKCAQKHAEMLLAWRKSLVANSKGKPINIKVLLPLMKKGYVAMDENGRWSWYDRKPYTKTAFWSSGGPMGSLSFFNIKPAENWKTSLMECGL